MSRPERSFGGLRLGDRIHLSDEISAYVRALVITGKLRGGDRIRVEQLAKELGVSATPVREALISLRHDVHRSSGGPGEDLWSHPFRSKT